MTFGVIMTNWHLENLNNKDENFGWEKKIERIEKLTSIKVGYCDTESMEWFAKSIGKDSEKLFVVYEGNDMWVLDFQERKIKRDY